MTILEKFCWKSKSKSGGWLGSDLGTMEKFCNVSKYEQLATIWKYLV